MSYSWANDRAGVQLQDNSTTLAPALNRSGQYEHYVLSILSYTRHFYCVNVGLHLQR